MKVKTQVKAGFALLETKVEIKAVRVPPTI
jgi:hypothetical protein